MLLRQSLDLIVGLTLVCLAIGSHDRDGHYVNQFAVEVEGGSEAAKLVAKQSGFDYIEPVGVGNYYVFSHKKVPRRHKREAVKHVSTLASHPQVIWTEQQMARKREKRKFVDVNKLTAEDRAIEEKAYGELGPSFDDPMWVEKAQDWYMFDHTRTPVNDSESVKTDLGVVSAWQKGYTGKGVVVSILDDGLEWNHTDIHENYSPEASFDINDNDTDPFPRYDFSNENSHGTKCAGVIAMVRNNNYCGVGIAPHAKVGGVRMLDGDITELTEAKSVSYNVANIDIMSASWGPSDNGRMVDGPGQMGEEAFVKGITEGRHGRGVIYIWASGNGGHRGDNCECDGYVSSPYTISISAITNSMRSPYYVEHCPSTMAATFSSGGYNEGQIVSAALHNKCTKYFTGTSASAPQGAGIVALALEANPHLGWRDVQHLIAWSAKPYSLYMNEGWKTNAAGFKVNHRFGFGVLNAINMVDLAENWKNVGPRLKCEIEVTQGLPKDVSSKKETYIGIKVDKSACKINYLEHIELVMSAAYTKRGDLSIDLTSAQGTTVSMMRPRSNDFDTIGYVNWPFMSVQTWGETPYGEWGVKVWDGSESEDHSGQVTRVMLRLFGTEEMPPVMKGSAEHRRTYNYQLEGIINKKYPSGDVTGDIVGDIAGWFNIG